MAFTPPRGASGGYGTSRAPMYPRPLTQTHTGFGGGKVTSPPSGKPPAPRPPLDPLSMTFQQFVASLNPGILNQFGLRQVPGAYRPLSNQQISGQARAMIQAQIAPVLRQIQRAYATRSASGSAALKGLTDAYVQAVGGYAGQVGDIYNQAKNEQGVLDQALAARLGSAGQTVGADVAGKLAQAGQPSLAATSRVA